MRRDRSPRSTAARPVGLIHTDLVSSGASTALAGGAIKVSDRMPLGTGGGFTRRFFSERKNGFQT